MKSKMKKRHTVSTVFRITGIALQSCRTSKPGGDLGDPLKQAFDNLGRGSFVWDRR